MAESGKIPAEGRWVICPECGKQKLLRLLPGGSIDGCELFCKHCRRKIKLNNLSLSP